MGFLMPPHPLTNFEIQKYYQNEPRFNGVFSRNNLPKKIKDGAYVINLDEYADVGTHWIALFCRIEIFYFNSFGVEHVPEEIKEFIGNKNIKANIFQVQPNNLKLVSAIFYEIFIFSSNNSPSKTMKMFFTSSKKLFLVSRYSNFLSTLPRF